MTRVSHDQDVATLITTFTVEPENQLRLVAALTDGIRTTIAGLPGFVSANIHRSLDGTKVVNYAQWSSQEALDAAFNHPEAMAHMRIATDIAARTEPTLYEVSFAWDAASR